MKLKEFLEPLQKNDPESDIILAFKTSKSWCKDLAFNKIGVIDIAVNTPKEPEPPKKKLKLV